MSAAQASLAPAAESVSPDDVKPVPYDDGMYKQILSDIKYLKRRLCGLVHNVHNQLNRSHRRSLLREISMVGDRLRRLSSLSKDRKPTCEHDKEFKGTSENSSDVEGTALKPVPYDGIDNDDRAEFDYLLKHSNDGCSELAWVRKVKKPGRFLGIAKGRTFIKEMRGLYFPLSKGLILSHGLQSRRHRSSKRRRLFKCSRLSKRQHSKDPNPIWEDGSEDSHYAEGTALHKDPSPTHEDVLEDSSDVEETALLKLQPAPLDSVVLPKRSPSPQDPYTSLDDDNKSEGISEDSNAEVTFLPEVQNTTSEDGSDVEDGSYVSDVEGGSDVEDLSDVKDVEGSCNIEDVEDSTNFGEVEDSSDGEYSSDGTTLLKPVPYIDKLRGEDPEVKKAIESLSPFYDPPSRHRDDYIDYLKLTGGDVDKHYLIAGPVLQVIAVHISTPTSKELKIYGHISVTDDKYNTYYIYNRPSECPEKVSPGFGFLPLNRYCILPLICGNVEFMLKDGDDIIFERKGTVEYLAKHKDGHVRKLGIRGKANCRATMFFTIIPYARIAEFKMHLWEPHPAAAGEAFPVYGRIKANKALCFMKVPEDPLEMWHGAYNYIGQSVLAVSIFSPLLLDVELYSHGTKLAYDVCRAVFLNFKFRELTYTCYNKTYEFKVGLEWISYSDYFEEWSIVCPQINKPNNYPSVVNENVKSDNDLPSSVQVNKPTDYPTVVYENEKSDYDLPVSVPKEKSDNNLPASMQLNPETPAVTSDDGPLVEVFSVLVGGGDSSAPLALCGTIVVRDGGGTFYIFSRNQHCPDELSSSDKLQQSRTSLSLAWPWRCVVEKKLFIYFNLKDALNHIVCRGSLSWYKRFLEGPYDTRICAIIPGENGYFAAVHFSVFKNGLQAKVTVECSSSSKDGPNYNNDHVSVYGSVFAEYGNYNYPSIYEKEYYRSIIFKRSKKNGVKVKDGSKIPLSKSMVSAPSDCEEIIVDVDLLVISSGERCRFGRALGRIRFKANKNGVCEMGDGDGGEGWRCANCHIKVMVDWVHK